ncbi:MAG: WhiB family transcriptional regulator [Caulobacteraceae bacterium]|nr:WhiB family transcriptional regulator [Caulobacteraceae bacterium]
MFQDKANCLNADPAIFFSAKLKDRALALSLCNACVVKDECLDFALSHESIDGIYGGLLGDERKALLKNGSV